MLSILEQKETLAKLITIRVLENTNHTMDEGPSTVRMQFGLINNIEAHRQFLFLARLIFMLRKE